jgi:serine/threonine protein kinase
MDGTQVDDSLLNELAIYIAKLHDKGVLHLDLSPGNVMYIKTTEGVQFTLIDINRMQFFESISKENRFKNFKRITENTTVLKKLAAYYSQAANYNEPECVDKIVKYSTQFFIARNRNYNEV